MHARYLNGRIPLAQDAFCEIGHESITIRLGETALIWPYAELRRADDGNGRIVFKRRPDTGERLTFEANEAEGALRLAAPQLFKPRAHGVEPPLVVGGVAALAWSLAGGFLIGIPMMSGPIADVMPLHYREQISDISWSQVNALSEYCDDSDEAADILNGVAYRMMEAANVTHRDDIWITIVDAPFPNAFALPDDSIIVTDDLIALAEHPDELTGVIAHEIAHIERNHIMQGAVKQIGAGVFFDIVFGGAGAGQAIAIASVNLAGLRYSRGDEEDADASGLNYLDAAGIDPGPLADLFDRLRTQEEEAVGEIPTMLSSHPATAARAAAARARARPERAPSLTDAQWEIVRRACTGGIVNAPAFPEPGPVSPHAAQSSDANGGKPGATGED